MTLTANSQGKIAGKFTIPANIPAGSKLVEFYAGSDQRASATFIGRGTLETDELQLVTTVVNRRVLNWPCDPLAQTFTLPGQVMVSAVDLWFQAKGASNVLVQIRDVDNGFPTADVLAESILTPADISLSAATRFKFPSVALEANHDYALVIACDDAVTALWVGELGQFDTYLQKWVTSQPYQIGVLLSSSNNKTWTAHQDKDLTFRLLAADYNVNTNQHNAGETTKDVVFDPVDVTDADQLLIMAAVDRPTANTDVRFIVTCGANVYTMIEGQPLTLAARYTGTITWKAVLVGTYTDSPAMLPHVSLIAGTRAGTGTYITRAMDCGTAVRVAVIYNALLTGSAAVVVAAEDDNTDWQAVSLDSSVPLGDGWAEYTHVLDPFTATQTRIRLTLSGTNLQCPQVKNLRVTIT